MNYDLKGENEKYFQKQEKIINSLFSVGKISVLEKNSEFNNLKYKLKELVLLLKNIKNNVFPFLVKVKNNEKVENKQLINCIEKNSFYINLLITLVVEIYSQLLAIEKNMEK